MEIWFIILVSISISLFLKSIINLVSPSKKPIYNLPPGPPTIPIIGKFLWLRKPFYELEPLLGSLHAKFGSMVTLHIGSSPAIFVSDRSLAHQALVQNGAIFADRPPALGPARIIRSSNQHTVNTAFYGPTWRLLRRNLTAEILHPSRLKSYCHGRKWVLQILVEQLKSQSNNSSDQVPLVDHFRYAMFCLLVLMCFGDKLDEKQIREIEHVQRCLLLNVNRLTVLNFLPSVTKIVFRKRWEEFLKFRQNQEDLLIPLIRTRKKVKQERLSKAKEDEENKDQYVVSYVDTLLDLQLPDEKRKLDEGEMVSLCSEFLSAGTGTTSTALQWIMANVVKYPHVQEKLFLEINRVVGDGAEEVKDNDLHRIPYLKAVILEGLRRHPPVHFVLPHTVTEDVVLGGFKVPKNGTINFLVAEMGWDPKVWEDPMAFKPERFLSTGVFDITGSREIKMMPFGAGRRICPGLALAMHHLEYFVANLVWYFKWTAIDGDDVDLSEKEGFVVAMKNPLRAVISPRAR